MALPTFLDTVNKVLVRMREPIANDLFSDDYVTLIATFVNDALRQVEDANPTWSGLITEYTVNTVAGTAKYSLTNSANRVKIDTVINNTAPGVLLEAQRKRIVSQQQQGIAPDSRPSNWCNDGVDNNGDAQINLYPTPIAAEQITVTGWTRQGPLVDFDDVILVPEAPVFMLAVAFAVRERGEVGGTSTAEYFELAKRSLSDEIAYDSARNETDDSLWYWT